MLWTITPNPAIDYTYQIDQLVVGSSHRINKITKRPGGKGINVARVADSLGADVTVTGFIGGASGKFLSKELAALSPRITQEWVTTTVPTRNSFAVVADQATLFNDPGMPYRSEDWHALIDLIKVHIPHGGTVCVSGSFPPDTPPDFFDWMRLALAGKQALLIVDTSERHLLEAAAVADLVKPNESELLASTGATSISQGVRLLHQKGCGLVAVSRGENGMELWTTDTVITAQLSAHLEGNPTGAGDAAVAGWAMSLGEDPRCRTIEFLTRALINATATSAAAVVAPTAGEIDRQLRTQLLRDVRITHRPIGAPHAN